MKKLLNGYEALFDSMSEKVTPSKEDKIKIQSVFKYKKYGRNENLVAEGTVCKYVNFLLSGSIKKVVIDENANEIVLVLSVEGSWSTVFHSFFQQMPSKYIVTALENTEVLQISYNDFEWLCNECPSVNTFFRKKTEQGIIALNNRLVKVLNGKAKDRYLEFTKRYPHIKDRVPQYLIASYLGVTKEFLSKLKNQI